VAHDEKGLNCWENRPDLIGYFYSPGTVRMCMHAYGAMHRPRVRGWRSRTASRSSRGFALRCVRYPAGDLSFRGRDHRTHGELQCCRLPRRAAPSTLASQMGLHWRQGVSWILVQCPVFSPCLVSLIPHTTPRAHAHHAWVGPGKHHAARMELMSLGLGPDSIDEKLCRSAWRDLMC
jgi:hypothetical protein